VTNRLGVFEAEGGDYRDWASFGAALKARHALAWNNSLVASKPPVRNAARTRCGGRMLRKPRFCA